MRRLVLLIAAITIVNANASTQSCLPQGITFTTQAQIDNFQTNYPGCTEIEGDVTIQGADITNLNGLSVLTSIGGDLNVGDYNAGNPALTSLAGLENLTSIGCNLAITSNSALISLTGLHNVDSIGGGFVIVGNDALINFTGLEGLTFIGGFLHISYNNSLISLTGLYNLASIAGYFEIVDNFALTSFTGVESLTSIGTYLQIVGNDDLTSLAGLEGLASIGGALNIWYNFSLTSLAGLESLASVGGTVYILGNSALIALIGLESLTSIGGGLSIRGNSSLSTCNAVWLCDYLAEPNGAVYIYGNATGCNLMDLAFACGDIPCLPFGAYYFYYQSDIDNFSQAFPDCTELEGDVIISGNNITNLNGLSQITSIGGSVTIGTHDVGNPSLASLTGLENLTSIGGNLWIRSNSSLTNLTGLEGLTSIGSYLRINSNFSLTSLSGLGNLTSIGSYLEIRSNIALPTLMGLESLTSIGGSLTIGGYFHGNHALTNLEGLNNLTSIGGNLQITYNSSLSVCDAEWLCNLLANTGGTVTILNNAPECSSVIDVANSCGGMPCLPYGNYGFYSQNDINHFSQAFPGCSELNGNVTIQGNDIINLDGLSQINSIGGNLEIRNNSSLTSLTGMDSLTSIGSNLDIQNSHALTNLTGLEGLTSIGGTLRIGGSFTWSGNLALTSLAGLDNIAAGSITKLTIANNNSLSTCEVQSICSYLVAPTGTVYIFSNAPGCNSQSEVIAACETIGIEEALVNADFIVFPNPFSERIGIELTLDKPCQVVVMVYNNMGQAVAKLMERQFQPGINRLHLESSTLPPGFYFLRLQAGEVSVIRKIIKYQ